MPSIFSHPAVPLAIAAIVGSNNVGGRLLLAGVVASALPDADVLAFRLGIAYASEFGHRGFSHSLLFAAVAGAIALVVAPWLKARRFTAFLFITAACASHGLLDMWTNGGHGIAYFWPFTSERFFLPHPMIEVSTLNLRRFFGPAGLEVMWSEVCWIWLPAMLLAAGGVVLRRKIRPGRCGDSAACAR